MTARVRLTLSYALFLVAAGAVTLGIIYVAMRVVPNYPLTAANPRDATNVPSRQEILASLLNASGLALALLAVIGLTGGWILAGWVLRPLQEINRAVRRAAAGSLDHRIRLTGRKDEFTELADIFDTMLDRLQRSFEEQQRFAANASHELRTPLTITRTMLDVAIADPDNQDYRQLTTRLRDTNQRGIAIVNSLLHLSAIDRTPLTPAPVDLAACAARALTIARPEADATGITVTAGLSPAPALGDDVLLGQVAANLLENALRHNLPRGGTATLTTGVDPADPTRVQITVSNTGPPIDPAQLATLTEPFLRGRGRTTGGPFRTGHGLGLALVARITNVQGADLRLTANPGGGLTARFSLPARQPVPSRSNRTHPI